MKVEDLVLGLGLKEVEPGVQLLGSLVDVSDDLPLVLLDLLADLLQEGDAVAGPVTIPEIIVYCYINEKRDSTSTVPTEKVNFHNTMWCVGMFGFEHRRELP